MMIRTGKVVELKYTMTTETGKVLDSTGDGTESYRHGAGSIVPGLERALEGRQVGERFRVTLEATDAFGTRRRGVGPQPVPRTTFPQNADLRVGMKFQAESPEGRPMDLYIARIEQRDVFVDTNHPFAGMRLKYEVEVVSVRDDEGP